MMVVGVNIYFSMHLLGSQYPVQLMVLLYMMTNCGYLLAMMGMRG